MLIFENIKKQKLITISTDVSAVIFMGTRINTSDENSTK